MTGTPPVSPTREGDIEASSLGEFTSALQEGLTSGDLQVEETMLEVLETGTQLTFDLSDDELLLPDPSSHPIPILPKPRSNSPPKAPYEKVPGGGKKRGKFKNGYQKAKHKVKQKRKSRKQKDDDDVTKAAKRDPHDRGDPDGGDLTGGVTAV